jgi:hypothetical protein
LSAPKTGFCIFTDSICDGPQPIVTDGYGRPLIFASRVAAQREIADNVITRLDEFIDGERKSDDALCVNEYVVEVEVSSDGSISPQDSRRS